MKYKDIQEKLEILEKAVELNAGDFNRLFDIHWEINRLKNLEVKEI